MHINLGQNVSSRQTRGSCTTRPAMRQVHRLIPLNFSGSGEIIRQLARPCSHSNTYIRCPSLPLLPSALLLSSAAREAAGLFKLKSRRDLNFKISIWLANLSASFRPRERTTALPPPRRRGQIARVRHQKSFTSRALFPSFRHLLFSFSLSCRHPRPMLLLVLLRKVVELKISSLNGNTRASGECRRQTSSVVFIAKDEEMKSSWCHFR